MFIDTHAHLWWPGPPRTDKSGEIPGFDDDLDEVISTAKEAGVEKIIVPGTDIQSSIKAVELAKKYEGYIYAAVGIHPEEAAETYLADPLFSSMFNTQMKRLRTLIAENKDWIVAVGEIGTDANTQKLREAMTKQKEVMREQLEIAGENDLPVIIHTRKSLDEAYEAIDMLGGEVRGQMHCFSYDEPELEEVLKRGFYVSFAGNITWSKRLQRIVDQVPKDRLLLETDSPLMMPRDEKGHPLDVSLRNTPTNVTILAAFQAKLRGVSESELGRQTSENAKNLFGI